MVLFALVAACGGDDAPDPSPTTTTTSPTASPTTTPSEASDSPTATGPVFDCAPVQAAQQALDEAYGTELDELGIRRGDPRAQSVFTIVTTNQGPTYYAAVLAAAPPESSQDAQLVLDYYQRLSAQTGVVDPGTGSAEDLSTAMNALDDAGLAVNPDLADATAVVDAQERLQAAVEAACAGSTATESTAGDGESPTSATTSE